MLLLNRLCSNDKGKFGVFIYDRQVLCYTLELPWLGNIQNKSCIPNGEYSVSKFNHSRFGKVFEVKHVPFRSGILIHPGNTVKDTQGCILPGDRVTEQGVSFSRSAIDKLYSVLPSSFQLIIREV